MIGEALLGRGGVTLMLTLWCAAVGTAFLPLRLHRRPLLMAPGPLVGALLLIPTPYMLPVYVIVLALTAPIMGPATLLISDNRRANLARAGALVTAAGVLFGVVHLLPDWISWAAMPVMMFGLPVGGLLTFEAVARRRAWYGAAASAVAFVLCWAVWMGRAHYYHPQ
jgi:hypothetical protein